MAKKVAKQTVFSAKKKAEKEKLNDIDSDSNIIYRIAKQMKQENKDIIGEKCIRDDDGVLAFNIEDKKKAWKQHYERLLNVEFPWREEDQMLTQYLGHLFLSLKRSSKNLSVR